MPSKLRKLPHPPIDATTRPSGARPAWLGIIIGILAVAMLCWGAESRETVNLSGEKYNLTLSEGELVRTVTASAVQRGKPGLPLATSQSKPAGGSGKADCPT